MVMSPKSQDRYDVKLVTPVQLVVTLGSACSHMPASVLCAVLLKKRDAVVLQGAPWYRKPRRSEPAATLSATCGKKTLL